MYHRKMKRTFEESLAVGSAGERLVISELRKVTEVKDLTNYDKNKGYQQKGFDISFYNHNTKTWDRADVKTNVKYGKTRVELTKPNGNLGWAYTSTADFIICVDIAYNKIYYYSMKDLRNYLEKKRSNNTLKAYQYEGYYLTDVYLNETQLIKPYAHLINSIGIGVSTPGMGVDSGN